MAFGTTRRDAASMAIAVRQELFMPRISGLLAGLCLAGAALSAAPSAQAQGTAPAVSLTPGTKVYDEGGQEIGQIVKIDGDRVAVSIGGSGLVVPKDAFLKTGKGPALKASKAKILAVLKEAEADAAAVDGVLKPGAEVRSADGAAVLGTVKAMAPQGAVLATKNGNITMPRAAFFLSKKGLAVKVNEKQFVEGVKAARAQKKGG
jgi:rRNA processing protein Gar1